MAGLLRGVEAAFGRFEFALKWQRWGIHLGVELCDALVSAPAPGDTSVQEDVVSVRWRLSAPDSRDDRLRKCAAASRTKRCRRLGVIVRGITRLARRLLRGCCADSARLLRARNGTDESPAAKCSRVREDFGASLVTWISDVRSALGLLAGYGGVGPSSCRVKCG